MWLMPLHWRWMIFDLIGLVWDINSEQFAGIVYSNLLNLIFLETLAFSSSVFHQQNGKIVSSFLWFLGFSGFRKPQILETWKPPGSPSLQ